MPLTDTDCAATYKILVLGDSTVGKSSLLGSLTGHEFKEKCRPTIGLDFVRRTFEVDGALVNLNVWDTAGQPRFHSVTRKHYTGVQGIVLVYDVTDRESFTHLSFWVDSVNKGISNSKNKYDAVPMMLVGNKIDLESDRKISEEEGKQLATKIMAFDFIETSAKLNRNVFLVFKQLAQFVTETFDPKVMKSYHPYMLRPPEIMEQKRKETELQKRKQKFRFRKKKPKKKLTSDVEGPAVVYSNGADSNIGIINLDVKENKKKKKNKRGFKLTKTKLKVIRTEKKTERHLKKKKPIGFIWRKLFRRKRKTKRPSSEERYNGPEVNENSKRSKHRCVIS